MLHSCLTLIQNVWSRISLPFRSNQQHTKDTTYKFEIWHSCIYFKAWYLWWVFTPTGLLQLLTDHSFPGPENNHEPNCQFRCVEMECEFSIHLSLKCWIILEVFYTFFWKFPFNKYRLFICYFWANSHLVN